VNGHVKRDDLKDSLYEELEQAFDRVSKEHMKILIIIFIKIFIQNWGDRILSDNWE
jgi:hypothetical protein